MGQPKVFITRLIPGEGLKRIEESAEVEVWQEETPPPYDILLEKVSGIDGLLCLLTDRIDPTLMDAAGPTLKVISQMAVGFDNIDVAEATKRGIQVGNTPGVLTETTADFAFALLMAAGRRIPEGERYVRAGRWQTWGPTLLMGHDVFGATLGLLGFGRIGQAVARRASGFGMRVLFYDPTAGAEAEGLYGASSASFEEVLDQADFLSIHVPLTPQTRHFIGAPEFRRMKPTCVLVNTARGPVVDSRALYRALRDGEIAAAAMDVTEPEPILMDDPLLTLDNCLILPHIASSSVATRGKMGSMAADNLLAGLQGRLLPNCVNPGAMNNLSSKGD
jgi:glyoxylate reductase